MCCHVHFFFSTLCHNIVDWAQPLSTAGKQPYIWPSNMQEAHEAWNSMWRCVPQGKVHQWGDEDGSRVHLEVPHRSRSLVRPVVWKGEKPTGWQIEGGLNWEEGLKMGRRMSKKRSVSLEACCSLYWRGVLLPG